MTNRTLDLCWHYHDPELDVHKRISTDQQGIHHVTVLLDSNRDMSIDQATV